jgi:hypothetical protein
MREAGTSLPSLGDLLRRSSLELGGIVVDVRLERAHRGERALHVRPRTLDGGVRGGRRANAAEVAKRRLDRGLRRVDRVDRRDSASSDWR